MGDDKTQEDEELIRLALHNSPFFSCLDDEQIASFIAHSRAQKFQERDVVISEGCVDKVNPMNAVIATAEAAIKEATREGEDSADPGEADHEENPISDEIVPSVQSDMGTSVTPAIKVGSEGETTVVPVADTPDDRPIEPSTSRKCAPTTRSVYIVRSGKAGVWYQPNFNPATLGPGKMFGDGGFLFGRQHSASIIAKEPMECWVVDVDTFRQSILPSNRLRNLFDQYSTGSDEKGSFLTSEEFLRAITDQLVEYQNNHLDSVLFNLRLASAYSSLQGGDASDRIYLEDFCFLHLLVARPDSEVDMAFLLIDERHTGQIFLSDLVKFLRPVFPDIDYNGAFFDRYFGKDRKQSIRQMHFSQFFVDLQREIGKQAFLKAVDDSGSNGYLEPSKLVQILKSACGWRLSRGVVGRLEEVFCSDHVDWTYHAVDQGRRDSKGEQFFTYGDFLAFQEVLGNLPFICNLIDRVQETKNGRPVSPEDFKIANQVLGLGDRLTRRQVEIVFRLFDLDEDGLVTQDDTIEVCGVDYGRRLVLGPSDKLSFVHVPRMPVPKETASIDAPRGTEKGFLDYLKSGATDFLSAGLFGGFAAGLLFPIDLVKTRMMNQRHGSTILYNHSLECLQQTIRNEGIVGAYRGIVPQLLCIAPERAIKFQVHDLVRETIRSFDGSNEKSTHLVADACAGACAGASQILVTNPLEITKIRLQMQGETHRVLKARGIIPLAAPNIVGVVRALGFPGIYKGASACLVRDIPFSAIYFPSYVAWKSFLSDVDEQHTRSQLTDVILAGTLAAIPASILTTPADVVKTRLQTIARPGEVPYHGIRDCVETIYREEGPTGFFRGTLPRVLRLSPQLGITMFAYEGFMRMLGLSSDNRPPVDVPIREAYD